MELLFSGLENFWREKVKASMSSNKRIFTFGRKSGEGIGTIFNKFRLRKIHQR